MDPLSILLTMDSLSTFSDVLFKPWRFSLHVLLGFASCGFLPHKGQSLVYKYICNGSLDSHFMVMILKRMKELEHSSLHERLDVELKELDKKLQQKELEIIVHQLIIGS